MTGWNITRAGLIFGKNKCNDVLTGQWVEGPLTHTSKYMEWHRQNTILFWFVAQQLNDPRTTITHNVGGGNH